MSPWRLLFWTGAGTSAWVLVGYPAALALLPERRWDVGGEVGEQLPRASVVIAAYREREELAAKLRAIGEQDYPADRLQLIVVVDDDEETARLAREARPDAQVLFSSERGGKPAALNRGIAVADGDIVVMTDANNHLEPGSLRAALRHFADPSIAAVAGRRGEEQSAYDRYEDLIRRLETRTGSVAAMSGEFMAVRRALLAPFPEDAVVDDLWLLCHLARLGGRAVYEPAAGSTEAAIPGAAEVARRSRMGAGRLQMASDLGGLPWGFRWRVLSHKYGRLALPVMLPVVLISSLALARRQPYRAAAAAQVAGYGLALASMAGVRFPGPLGTIARACRQFTLGNYSVGLGLIRGIRGRQGIKWDPVR
jgi:cellulose synthase/poly-beta-1,6-N-acetylglucosamine synthase-like glycosyltransferase